MQSMIYNVDIDGILCECSLPENFRSATPKIFNIEKINKLSKSNTINIYTSRREEDREVTQEWLKQNKVNYDKLIMDKPSCDFYIDDFAISNLPYIRQREEDNKLTLCLSGGLDSTIAYYIAKKRGYDVTCLFFNIGQPYFKKELKVLKELNIPFKTIDISDAYSDFEAKTHIFDNRNAIFANIASIYSSRIWICGLVHEDHYLMFDKNSQFYKYISLSLTQSTGRNVIVETPYKEWSKTDILNYCKQENLLHVAQKTTSCYHPTKNRCGECSLCVRRFVAEKTAGVNLRFSKNPRESKEYKTLMQRYRVALKNKDFSHYSKKRIMESLKIDK